MNTDTLKDTDTPRAWIGCLGCYNAGRLIGKWLDGVECDDLQAAGLTDSDDKCLRCGADEFMALDHENYLGVLNGEVSAQEAADAAQLLSSVEDYERDILVAWLSNGMEFDLDAMRECYIGEYSSDEDMAEEYLDNTGLLSEIPEFIARYFDTAAYARDMMFDMFEINGHYFMSR